MGWHFLFFARLRDVRSVFPGWYLGLMMSWYLFMLLLSPGWLCRRTQCLSPRQLGLMMAGTLWHFVHRPFVSDQVSPKVSQPPLRWFISVKTEYCNCSVRLRWCGSAIHIALLLGNGCWRQHYQRAVGSVSHAQAQLYQVVPNITASKVKRLCADLICILYHL